MRALALAVAVAGCAAPDGAVGPLEVGAAARDITPPLGYGMRGYYNPRGATGVRDPLQAKALVFRQDDAEAALVVLDVCGIDPALTAAVRRRAAAPGLPAEHIVLAATHSHTGPEYAGAARAYAASGKDDGYIERLVREVSGAIADARAAALPRRLRAGTGRQESQVAFNRRFVMKDGSIKTWANFKDPEVVRPAGPIDPDVAVLSIADPGAAAPQAALVNFALHLDTLGGTLYSADFPHDLEAALRRELGPAFRLTFANGCCGDINHVDPRSDVRNKTPEIGEAIARTVSRALPSLRELDAPSLAVRRAVVRAPLQECPPAELAWADDLIARDQRGEKLPFLDEVKAYKLKEVERLRRDGPELPLEVHAIRLDARTAIVTLPGEVFVDHGLAIKKGSPFATTFVIELAGTDETNYIPTREQIPGGGYEVVNSVLAPGGGEMLVEAAIRLLTELSRR
jgi:hypothetical protein